jgi:hypothetical protein
LVNENRSSLLDVCRSTIGFEKIRLHARTDENLFPFYFLHLIFLRYVPPIGTAVGSNQSFGAPKSQGSAGNPGRSMTMNQSMSMNQQVMKSGSQLNITGISATIGPSTATGSPVEGPTSGSPIDSGAETMMGGK